MVVTAWAFVGRAGTRLHYGGESTILQGDTMSAIHWANRCKAATEPRVGALMSILGYLERDSDWSFRAKHVAGIANTLADGISRWQRVYQRFPPRI